MSINSFVYLMTIRIREFTSILLAYMELIPNDMITVDCYKSVRRVRDHKELNEQTLRMQVFT